MPSDDLLHSKPLKMVACSLRLFSGTSKGQFPYHTFRPQTKWIRGDLKLTYVGGAAETMGFDRFTYAPRIENSLGLHATSRFFRGVYIWNFIIQQLTAVFKALQRNPSIITPQNSLSPSCGTRLVESMCVRLKTNSGTVALPVHLNRFTRAREKSDGGQYSAVVRSFSGVCI